MKSINRSPILSNRFPISNNLSPISNKLFPDLNGRRSHIFFNFEKRRNRKFLNIEMCLDIGWSIKWNCRASMHVCCSVSGFGEKEVLIWWCYLAIFYLKISLQNWRKIRNFRPQMPRFKFFGLTWFVVDLTLKKFSLLTRFPLML